MAAQTLIAPNFYNLEPNHLISMIGDELRTTSLKVAEAFGKLHKDVLRKIGNLDCSPEFASAHFYANVENQAVGTSRRDMKYYEMTKDGFMFLVMGFTGKKAAQIKEAYINAFNWMAAQLFGRPVAAKTTTDARTPLRAAVSMLVGKRSLMYPDAYALVHQRFGVEHIDQLAPEQIGQAVEYVHRLVLEGEVLPAEKKGAYHFPKETAAPHDFERRAFINVNMTPDVLLDSRNRAPELELIEALERDGHDVAGAKIRILALRDAAAWQVKLLAMMEDVRWRLGHQADRIRQCTDQRGMNVVFDKKPTKKMVAAAQGALPLGSA